MRAVKLYIKYDKCTADVVRELGYPYPGSLREWYKEYLKEKETDIIWDKFWKPKKYTAEQKHFHSSSIPNDFLKSVINGSLYLFTSPGFRLIL